MDIPNIVSQSKYSKILSGCPETCWYITGTVGQVLHNVYRPGLEYAAPVWHPGLAQQLADIIERVQNSSLQIVYPDLSYGRALEETGLLTLHARRDQLCLGFAESLSANDQFIDWFPPRQSLHGRNLRNKAAINIRKCKTNRTLNSPI